MIPHLYAPVNQTAAMAEFLFFKLLVTPLSCLRGVTRHNEDLKEYLISIGVRTYAIEAIAEGLSMAQAL